jgi:hypothetical protein
VSWIRADNAGENQTLQKLIEQDPHLKAKFEKTPRDTPQYNGAQVSDSVEWNQSKLE